MKKELLKVVAKISENSAHKAAGAASGFCFHQPKEPKCLQEQVK